MTDPETARLVLVTRPEPDAAATAALLVARGYRVLIDPAMEIVFRPPAEGLTWEDCRAFLVTSANGARALAAALDGSGSQTAARALPVMAVGAASAAAARAAGFADVTSADADVAGLAALAARRLDPGDGVLIHAAGSAVAGDLSDRLSADGFTVRRAVLYEARPTGGLDAATVAELRDGAVAAVLFYSPRTAKIFRRHVAAAGLAGAMGGIAGFCLSPAVADRIADLGLGACHVAARPDQAALLAALDTHLGANPVAR